MNYNITLTFREYGLFKSQDTQVNCQVEARDAKEAFDKAYNFCYNSGHTGQVVREVISV
jgi:hypothetical protein